MSNYYISNGQLVEVRDDELMHIAVAKGTPREDHKYISREWKNGKWIYTYKDDSKGSAKKAADKSANAVKNTTNSASIKRVSSDTNSANSSAVTKVDSGRDIVNKVLPNTTSTTTTRTPPIKKSVSSENLVKTENRDTRSADKYYEAKQKAKSVPTTYRNAPEGASTTLYDAGKANQKKKEEEAKKTNRVSKSSTRETSDYTDNVPTTYRNALEGASTTLYDAGKANAAKKKAAEKEAKAAERAAKIESFKTSLKNFFSDPPLDTIESGRDRVKNWFEDLFD